MRKPINPDTLNLLVANIRNNLEAFDKGYSVSTDHAEQVMESLTQLMRDGHVIDVSIWPQGDVTQVWEVRIDSIKLCIGGVLRDETAVPRLIKQGRG